MVKAIIGGSLGTNHSVGTTEETNLHTQKENCLRGINYASYEKTCSIIA